MQRGLQFRDRGMCRCLNHTACRARLKGSGGRAVGIDQAGKGHAREESELKTLLASRNLHGGTRHGRRPNKSIRLSGFLNRSEQGALGLYPPLGAEQIILQRGMMPRHHMGEQRSPSRLQVPGSPDRSGR
jgi:hypothetical protein